MHGKRRIRALLSSLGAAAFYVFYVLDEKRGAVVFAALIVIGCLISLREELHEYGSTNWRAFLRALIWRKQQAMKQRDADDQHH